MNWWCKSCGHATPCNLFACRSCRSPRIVPQFGNHLNEYLDSSENYEEVSEIREIEDSKFKRFLNFCWKATKFLARWIWIIFLWLLKVIYKILQYTVIAALVIIAGVLLGAFLSRNDRVSK